jgi:hypothetical protein
MFHQCLSGNKTAHGIDEMQGPNADVAFQNVFERNCASELGESGGICGTQKKQRQHG